jgi:hypothetical protein
MAPDHRAKTAAPKNVRTASKTIDSAREVWSVEQRTVMGKEDGFISRVD